MTGQQVAVLSFVQRLPLDGYMDGLPVVIVNTEHKADETAVAVHIEIPWMSCHQDGLAWLACIRSS